MKFSTWFDTSKDAKLSCSCGCGFTMENRELMAIAACIRIHFKAPVTITSGPRCRTYNATVSTATQSRHIYGDALDIQVKGVEPAVVQQWVIDNFPLVSVGKGKTFTHVDCRPLPRKVFNY